MKNRKRGMASSPDTKRLTTTIRVSPETASRLVALGVKGQTYDEIIQGLLERGKKND